MKRELKDHELDRGAAGRGQIARHIPMKRELKVIKNLSLVFNGNDIARHIPMKRELKDHRYRFKYLVTLRSQGTSR